MDDKPTTRRDFAKTGIRSVLSAGIVALAGWLAVRRLAGSGDWSGQNRCTGDAMCSRCNRLDTCILPQASSARKAQL